MAESCSNNIDSVPDITENTPLLPSSNHSNGLSLSGIQDTEQKDDFDIVKSELIRVSSSPSDSIETNNTENLTEKPSPTPSSDQLHHSSSVEYKMNSNSSNDDFSSSTGEKDHLSCKFEREYPLHWHVWHNDINRLNVQLAKENTPLEQQDPRGRTPLLLAVTLGHLEAARILLRRGCSTQADSPQGWTVVQEAVSCGDPELVGSVLQGRDSERHSSRALGIPHLLQKLAQAPDFYVEMKWEFTSWVPLVSRMCPSDTYRVFKRGSSVRIDTTLLGFRDTQWQRGSRSYIFRGQGDNAVMFEVDHDKEVVYMEKMQSVGAEGVSATPDSLIAQRLTSPNVATTVDTDKISFERDKCGIWGWRADKSENINGHDCKVFSASNVEIETRTRTEHMTAADKARTADERSPLHSFFAATDEGNQQRPPLGEEGTTGSRNNPCSISPLEYFDEDCDLTDRDIGRPKEMASKIQKFKAVLWLAEEYPLRLEEQVMPIVDLMAISSTHFAKLQHFIQMQLPSGFPVKIEIPLFHVLTARITFGNIFGLDSGVEGVTSMEDGERLSCLLDQDMFVPPHHYSCIGGSEPHLGRSLALEEDDALLQFALHQSLVEAGRGTEQTMDVWQALSDERGDTVLPNPSPAPTGQHSMLLAAQSAEQTDLQRAIEESLLLAQVTATSTASSGAVATLPSPASPMTPYPTIATNTSSSSDSTTDSSVSDSDLALALSLSKRQLEDDEQRRRRHEEEMLQQILQLSLSEK